MAMAALLFVHIASDGHCRQPYRSHQNPT